MTQMPILTAQFASVGNSSSQISAHKDLFRTGDLHLSSDFSSTLAAIVSAEKVAVEQAPIESPNADLSDVETEKPDIALKVEVEHIKTNKSKLERPEHQECETFKPNVAPTDQPMDHVGTSTSERVMLMQNPKTEENSLGLSFEEFEVTQASRLSETAVTTSLSPKIERRTDWAVDIDQRTPNLAPAWIPQEDNITELAPKVAELAPKVAELAPKVAELAPKVAELAPKVAELAPKVAELAPKVAELVPKVNKTMQASSNIDEAHKTFLYEQVRAVPASLPTDAQTNEHTKKTTYAQIKKTVEHASPPNVRAAQDVNSANTGSLPMHSKTEFNPPQPILAPDLIPKTDQNFKIDLVRPETVQSPNMPQTPAQVSLNEPAKRLVAHNAPQIADAILSIRETGGQIDIALKPEDLGRLSMKIDQTTHSTLVSLAAERPDTQDLMRRQIEVLQAQLKSMGFENLSFAFEQNSGRKSGDGSSALSENNTDAQNTNQPPTSVVTAASVASGVDIRI